MKLKKLIAVLLATAVAAAPGSLMMSSTPVFAAPGADVAQNTVTYNEVTFNRASAAYVDGEVSYEGMPLFNGNAEDLDAYVDLVMEELGVNGWISILAGQTPTGTYTDTDGIVKTYNFPNNLRGGNDVGVDGETQWPNQLSQAQTWNLDLMEQAGSVYGDEIRSKNTTDTISGTATSGAHVAQVDIHSNPLSGRYDEGYGEDALLISQMANAWTDGMAGDESEDDFYLKAFAQTKHWSTYNSEFFRCQGGNNVSSRTFYEYYAKAATLPFSSGNIIGYMSSYGNVNGVPTTSSFMNDFAQANSKYGLVTGCDFMSEYGYLTEQYSNNASAFSNGYDETYSTSAVDRAASMLLAGHKQGGNANLQGDEKDTAGVITAALENHVEGLAEEDIAKVVRPTIVALTRTGALDERDENGQPRYYPYINDGTNTVDHTSEVSQKTELQMAEEGIVLLKNEDNTLPLSKESDAAVYGIMAQTMQYGQYSSLLNSDIDSYNGAVNGAGYNILEAIREKLGEDKVQYATGDRVVAYKTAGGYLTASADGAQLTVTDVDADTAASETAYQFDYADWSQDAFSLLSLSNNKWVKAGIKNNSLLGITMGLTDSAVSNTGEYSMKPSDGLALSVSNMPLFMEKQEAEGEGNYYLKFGSKYNNTDFSTTWALTNKMGWYMQTNKDGTVSLNGEAQAIQGPDLPFIVGGNLNPGVSAFQSDSDKEKYIFTEETIKEAGADSAAMAESSDYAVVVIGQPYNGISGEGVDRAYLNLSEDQMDMVKNVAANYAAEGKKTIVIINTEYPVEAEDLQNDENVSAIVFNPYGGQYDAVALANVLYGDAAPTGRLVSTWYKSEDALPSISEYSLPNNAMASIGGQLVQGLTLDDIDDAVTVDMTESDLQQSGLTYMYADADDVTYEFGYGLSYSTFRYSSMAVKADANGNMVVTLKVKNTGSVATSDVVQIYASNPDSEYGNAAADKKLVGFAKIALAPGASKTVTVNVDSVALEVYDVNAKDYVVEPGAYVVYAAHSSDLTKDNVLSKTVNIKGTALAVADTSSAINVWSNSFDASDVKYVEASKGQTAEAAAADSDEMFAVMSKGAGSWIALSKINLTDIASAELSVASTAGENTIEIRANSPTGKLLGTVSFGSTEAVTNARTADNDYDAGNYTELGYTTVTAELAAAEGVQDIYLVFKNANTRINTITFSGTEKIPDGWNRIDNKWYLYKDNVALTGWQLVGTKWYYMNSGGVMQTGWVKPANVWYYLDESGAMATGWRQVDGKWYYLKESGAMATGWVKVNGKWYYLSGSGAMQTGWIKDAGKWYYLSGSGAMQTGWIKDAGKWYYLNTNGAMAVNTWIGNYYVDASGVWTATR